MSFVSGGALPCVVHIFRGAGLMFMGGSCGLQVLGIVCGHWVIVCGRWVVVCGQYALFMCNIHHLWVGADVHGCGCLVVICGHVGAMVCVVLCVIWSLLAGMNGTNIDGTYLETTTTNDEIIVIHHLVATSLSVTWHLETPILLIGLAMWRCHIMTCHCRGCGRG